ncbi:PEP-utilizing enzyme [Mycobacterium sp.]|uniref:PEP-utilizing enzyme n=1 Tax=Mycobacterium sp. TaxID=1785 RepID=UPI001227E88E|nr:PEP-utilizing enzyme [Mycobacterium sp.]TAM69756.1 MAG: peptidase [Mycobacterium sp.]
MTQITDPVRGTSEPGRFWTLANTGEVTPGVLSPLDWSVWDSFELATREGWYDLGIMAKSEIFLPQDPNMRQSAVFFGRHAMNVDYVRARMGTIPGGSPDDFERDTCGSIRDGLPPQRNSYRRVPAMVWRLPRCYRRTSVELIESNAETKRWWTREVLHGNGSTDPVADLRNASVRFRETMRLHIRVRTFITGVQGALVSLADKVGRPDLALPVFAGYGDITELSLGRDMRLLGTGEISAADFVERYGYYGPNEGLVWTRAWRENPEALLPRARALAERADPDVRSRAATEARIDAERQILAACRPLQRSLARQLFAHAARQVRNLELAKSTYHMAIDGCRAAARRVGLDLADRGVIDHPEDVFFFTIAELEQRPPVQAREIVEFRKARRAEYLSFDIPMTFHGVPETIPRATAEPVADVDALSGIPGSPGTVEGVVCVVDDADDDIDPGVVLVCRTTNPSWTPLFGMADALVLDIGGPNSHGPIIAREMGIPCVINVGNATAVLRDGDRVRVNGTDGTVTILARANNDLAAY